MKKLIALLLAVVMVVGMTACGGSTKTVEGKMEDLANQIITENPVEFMGGIIPVDLTDTSEDGVWAVNYNTGLKNGEKLTDIAVFEPMMGSMAFSMVMVRTAEGADSKAVAESMKSGIDTRKWICVEADDLKVAGFGDVVMLIMVNSDSGMTAQSFVDAFATVAGFQPEFVM